MPEAEGSIETSAGAGGAEEPWLITEHWGPVAFCPLAGTLRAGLRWLVVAVPQSSPSWASVHVHCFKNKLQCGLLLNVLKIKCKRKEDYLLKINKGLHSGIDFLDYYF